MKQIVTDAITPVQAEADATGQRATDLETAVTEIAQKLQAGDTDGALATATAAVPTTADSMAGGSSTVAGASWTAGAGLRSRPRSTVIDIKFGRPAFFV